MKKTTIILTLVAAFSLLAGFCLGRLSKPTADWQDTISQIGPLQQNHEVPPLDLMIYMGDKEGATVELEEYLEDVDHRLSRLEN